MYNQVELIGETPLRPGSRQLRLRRGSAIDHVERAVQIIDMIDFRGQPVQFNLIQPPLIAGLRCETLWAFSESSDTFRLGVYEPPSCVPSRERRQQRNL